MGSDGITVADGGPGSVLRHLPALLSASVARRDVPGASLAVWAGGQLYEAAAGWANREARIEATPDTVFHFGSVTKTLTSTLVVRLSHQGRIDLDAPVQQYVPEFSPPDPAVAASLTVRHCLSHRPGLVDLLFVDTGRNDDALSRQITAVSGQPQYHPPGALTSYCNNGMLMLGRAIETVLAKPWHAAILEDLAAPLGMDGVGTRPEQALRRRYAVGHVFDVRSDAWIADPNPFWMPGHAPAGSTCFGRARDLIALARLHLDGGRSAASGEAFLSPSIVETMQQRVAALPVPFLYAGWGLGWFLYDWGGRRIIGHDGSTGGSNAYLRIDSTRGVAAALLVNCRSGLPVYEDVFSRIFGELCEAWEPVAPPIVSPGAIEWAAGSYGNGMIRIDLEPRSSSVQMTISPLTSTPLTRALGQTLELHPCGPAQFFVDGTDAMLGARNPPADTRLARPYALIEAAGTQWLHSGQLAFRRL